MFFRAYDRDSYRRRTSPTRSSILLCGRVPRFVNNYCEQDQEEAQGFLEGELARRRGNNRENSDYALCGAARG